MIGLSGSLDLRRIDRIESDIQREMRAAIPLSLTYLKELCVQIIVRMGAVDTMALLLSVYISAFRYSEYEEAMNEAAEAYQNNPTKYPDIRKALGNPGLSELPELKPESPDEGWLGIGAAHGVEVEQGYVSFYGNEVPARPFVADTAAEGMPLVIEQMLKAIRKAAGL